MKICSVTITPTEAEAQDAITSVEQLVDRCVTVEHDRPITDFSEARNDLLTFAHGRGYDWALMLDTDERIICEDPLRMWDTLSFTEADVLMVGYDQGNYAKERFFRLPARGRFVGPVHEAFILTDRSVTRESLPTDLITFSEESKTAAGLRSKLERDVAVLRAWTGKHPDDPRWWYYLGDTQINLGHPADAITSFARCWSLNGWDEESAWACYRAAEVAVSLDLLAGAIEWCLKGMERRPDFPEFPWLIGWCCYQQGRDEAAVHWARMATHLKRTDPLSPRIGFRYPPAHHEAPYDVLRHAYRRLGRPEAEATELLFAAALRGREKSAPPRDP